MDKIIDFNEFKNRKLKKRNLIYLVFAVILIYIFYSIFLLVRTPNETVTVEKGTLTLEESATGYVIRDEVVLKGNNYKNGLTAIISEGERAHKGQTIFRYSSSNEEQLKKQIEDVNLKIQEALAKQPIIPSTDIKNLDKKIDEKNEKLRNLTDIQQITEFKKQIQETVEKKAKISGELSQRGSYIKELTNQKESYEKQLTEGSEYITAPEAGVVSYRVDGLESVLTPEDFSNITEEKLNALDLKTGKIVSTSQEQGKIVDNFDCYLGAILNSEAAKNAKIGDKVTITLSSGNEITSEIKYIANQESGKILVIFDLKTLTTELTQYRKISFNITWWSFSGLKVPTSSIAEDEKGLKYVIKKKSSGDQKVLIKELKRNEKYSIISTYKNEELAKLGIDIATYSKISQYDNISLYPNLNKVK